MAMTKQELREMIAEEVERQIPKPPPVQKPKRIYSVLDCDVPLEGVMRWLIIHLVAWVLVSILLGILAALVIGFWTALASGSG